MALEKEVRDRWINAIVDLSRQTTLYGHLDDRYSYSHNILGKNVYLYQGILKFDVIKRNIEELIKQSDNQQTDGGAIVLRLLKTNDDLEGTKKYKQQHKMVDLLSRMHLQLSDDNYIHLLNLLSAKDKLTVLNLFEFKYNTEEYKRIYQKLGKFKLGENPKNLEAEKKAVVHTFHNLLNSLKRSKDKKSRFEKISSAQTFLESLAENRYFLLTAAYEEKVTKKSDDKKHKKKKEETGKILTISSADRVEMLKFIQESDIEFSEKILDFFTDEPASANVNSYLQLVLKKVSFVKDKIEPVKPPYSNEYLEKCQKNLEYRKNTSTQNFGRINTLLELQELVFDDTVKLYATYLFNHASLMTADENISPDILKSLINKNIQSQNAKLRAESIFPDSEPEIKDNKDLVLQVAEIYANSFMSSDPEAEEFNPAFHKKMTDMFKQITVEQKYNHKDIQNLCNTLKKNPDIEMQRMANNIASSPSFSGNSNSGYSF